MSLIKKSGKDRDVTINASSMADITFLLLLFFLVTTTIDVDTGIFLTLPEYVENPKDVQEQKMSKDQFITVNVNEAGSVLVSGEVMQIGNITNFLKPKIEKRIDNTAKLLVSIKTARGTNYNLYIETLDAIKEAFFQVQEELAQRKFGKKRYELTEDQKKEISKLVPANISLAEPEKVN